LQQSHLSQDSATSTAEPVTFFIEWEQCLQQLDLITDAGVSLLESTFFFIGQKSPLQQQHAETKLRESLRPDAIVTTASPNTISVMITSVILLFIVTSYRFR
jgi:hypothetical protein